MDQDRYVCKSSHSHSANFNRLVLGMKVKNEVQSYSGFGQTNLFRYFAKINIFPNERSNNVFASICLAVQEKGETIITTQFTKNVYSPKKKM